MKRNNVMHYFEGNGSKYGYGLDTLVIAKKTVVSKKLTVPTSYKLSDLYNYVADLNIG